MGEGTDSSRRAGIAQAVASLRLSLFIRHDLRRQSLATPTPPGRDRAEA
jgi:hypothetical protein